MKKNTLKRSFACVVLGLSVACAGICPSPVDAKTAIKFPAIKVKSTKISVCADTTLDIQNNVVEAVKDPAAIRKIIYKVDGDNSRIKISQTGKMNEKGVPAGSISFRKPGTYKLTVRVIDTKGRVAKKVITFVAGKSIMKYTKNIYDLSSSTAGMKVDFKKGLSWDRKHIGSIKVDTSGVDYKKVGDYEVVYTIIGLSGEVKRVKCPVRIVKSFKRYDRYKYTQINNR